MRVLKYVLFSLLSIAVVGGVAVGLGVYDVAADAPHWPAMEWVLQLARARSVAVRAADVRAPDLDDAARVRSGAGNYDAMCATCHLRPGRADSELHRGLYPQPPDLTRSGIADPAQAFWTIKHGVKMSAMPAWGRSMQDDYIWSLVAFLRRLPQMTPEQYLAEVAASGGHHHGGGEDHGHGETGAPEHVHDESAHDAQEAGERAQPHEHPQPQQEHDDGHKH